jgi:transcriptional regulator with XRE-family HTH domain
MLGNALRLMRVFHDLKQNELAGKLGISNAHLSEIESGKKQPSMQLLNRYSEEFDIPLSSILFFSESLDENKDVEAARKFLSGKVLAMMGFIAKGSEVESSDET